MRFNSIIRHLIKEEQSRFQVLDDKLVVPNKKDPMISEHLMLIHQNTKTQLKSLKDDSLKIYSSLLIC